MPNKQNPRKRPATMADVEKAKKAAHTEAVGYAMTIFFTVLFDKHEATKDELKQFWEEVGELSDSIAQGYVSVSDLRTTLRTQYDIKI